MPKTQNYRIVYVRPGPARTPEETRENNRGEGAPGPGAGPGRGRQPLLGAYSSHASDPDPDPDPDPNLDPRSWSQSRFPDPPVPVPHICLPARPLRHPTMPRGSAHFRGGATSPCPPRPAPPLVSPAAARTRRSQPIGCRAWVEAANGRLGTRLKGGAVALVGAPT